MTFFDFLKNLFLVLLLLQFAPIFYENIKKQYGRYLTPKSQVGVITINGQICSSECLTKQLRTFFEDTEIKAILLKIECPGGAAGASQAIHNELLALKKEYPKPVVVLVENLCASGGYYIASASDYIVSSGSAMIGSIGSTIPYFFQLRETIEQLKIHYVPLKAGTYKTMGDPFVDITTDEKALLQGVLNDSYQQFAADVARNRKLPLATLTTWADGKVFSGQQALKLGLIDEIGSAHNAIKVLKERALIEGDIEWVKPPKRGGLLTTLLSNDSDDDGVSFSVSPALTEQMAQQALKKVLTEMAHAGISVR